MKKAKIAISIFCIMLCVTNVTVYASEERHGSEKKPIIEVIKEQNDVKKTDKFFDKQYYDKNLQEYDFSDDIVMKVYYESMWHYAGEDIESVISEIDETFMKGYVVFEDEPIRIGEYKRGDTKKFSLDGKYEECPTYLSDIINSSIYNSEKEGEYSQVICFDATNSMGGVVVYYVDGEDTIVYYYEDVSAEALRFNLKDFQTYGVAYNNYITSDENNYSENGMFLGGGTKSFATFVNQVDIDDYLKDNNSILSRTHIFTGVAVLVVLLASVCVIRIRQKKSNMV